MIDVLFTNDWITYSLVEISSSVNRSTTSNDAYTERTELK